MNSDQPGKEKLTPVEFTIVAVVLTAVISFFVFTSLSDPGRRHISPLNACINNLRQIDAAKQQWAMETKAAGNVILTWTNLVPYLNRGLTTGFPLPRCPAGGIYTIGSLTNAPTCSVKGHALN